MAEPSPSRSTLATLAALVVTAVSLGVAAAVSWAAGQQGTELFGLPVLALAAGLAFAVQWVAFVPAFALKTEHFYDLTGSLTYLTVTLGTLVVVGRYDVRSVVLAVLVVVWAVRLGSFLFRRVRQDGRDGRFDAIKVSAPRFFIAWTLQGLWVFLTLSAALAALTTAAPAPLGVLDGFGFALWLAGFAFEVVADAQKRRFKRDAAHRGRFIQTGLWAWSRHPNYFGEIVLWLGVFLIAASTLTGGQWATAISPLFVFVLLTRVSGVPLLEERADKRWGGQADYEAYKRSTPVLIPRPPRRNVASGPSAAPE